MRRLPTNLLAELRTDIVSAKSLPALTAGFTTGLGLLVAQVAFATFIFSGPLAPYSSQGVGLVLFGNFAGCLVVALTGGYRGAVAGLSPALVIVMALIASTMVGEGVGLFVNTAVTLILGAVIAGACCLLIGHFGLANLVRFIPYPVAAGFVGGIGAVVCLSAVSMMSIELTWRTLPALLEPSALWKWCPGVLFGLALYAALKRWGSTLILPVSVALAVAAYHLVLAVLGIAGDEARAAGLLFTSTANGTLWPPILPSDLVHVDWNAISSQTLNLLILVLVAMIAVVLNVAGLEVAANEELGWDREFQASGFASVVSGLGGGTTTTLIVPASVRSKLFGAATRLTGVVAALVVGGALFLGDKMLELVPVPLIGGILIFAGLGMLEEVFIRSRKRLPWTEYAIIVVISLSIISFGLLEGVGAGMLAMLVFFAVRLSRVDPIAMRFTVRERQSSRARSAPERAILLNEGERVRGYALRGYIFFGSVGALIDQLRLALDTKTPPACLVLDFKAVTGFDFSAVNGLSRFLQTTQSSGVQVVLSAPSDRLTTGLEHNLAPAPFAKLVMEPNEDRALEHCEEVVLATWRAEAEESDERRSSLLERTAEDLERHLERQIQFEDLLEDLRLWMNPHSYLPGERVAGPAITGQGLQFLVSGRATEQDDTGTRLLQYAPGDAIWSKAPDAGTNAVVADKACKTLSLAPNDRRWLEENRPELALRLYRYLLADRLEAPDDRAAGP
ncbi:MAG: SulP family inorganic anion transporter [Pseudomonadales bacterium]|nr:SulP family inorganic anion transporter [Pseudomonadales bacterium]